jgi:hypothetical protein
MRHIIVPSIDNADLHIPEPQSITLIDLNKCGVSDCESVYSSQSGGQSDEVTLSDNTIYPHI